MFKEIIKIITRPTTNSTKVINVINKDIKFNLYSYEYVYNKYKCIYIKNKYIIIS